MARAARLAKCPDCGRRVSARAVTCPGCGCPFEAQTIELTSKKWKATGLVFGLLTLVGMGAWSVQLYLVALPFLFFGIVGGVIAGFGEWWDHG
jgi:hypothetical protein